MDICLATIVVIAVVIVFQLITKCLFEYWFSHNDIIDDNDSTDGTN